MRPIRCLVMASYFGPYGGNFIASLNALGRELNLRGHEVFFVFPKAVEQFEWAKEFVNITDKCSFLDFAPHSVDNLRRIHKLIKLHKIDVVLSRMSGWDIASRSSTRCPVIWQMEMSVNNSSPERKIKNYVKYKLFGGKNTYHIAVSQPVSEQINGYRVPNKCVTIPNAIDFARLSDNRAREIDNNVKNILMFGWSPYVKGLDIAISACKSIISNGESVRLLVSAQEQTYRYMENEFDIKPDWIKLLPPTDNVNSLYRQADIMLSASRMEGFPYSVAEAIYSGLPVVASDIPGTSWAKEFHHVYFFKSEDANDLASTMLNAMHADIQSKDIFSNRELLNEKYSISAWSAKMTDFIESTVC